MVSQFSDPVYFLNPWDLLLLVLVWR